MPRPPSEVSRCPAGDCPARAESLQRRLQHPGEGPGFYRTLMHDAQIDAMIRWLAFIGLPLSASSVQRSPESSRRSRFRKVLQRVDGVEGFVRGLAAWPPVVLTMTTCSVCSGSGWSPATSSSGVSECWNCEGPLPPIPRERIMQAAISSVLACLLRAGEITTTDKTGAATIEHVGLNELDFVADLLLERGHAWLGEPLALWLVGEYEKAIDLLLDRVPVLPEFAAWADEDSRVHLRAEIDGEHPQNVFFHSGGYGRTAAAQSIADQLNAQLAGAVAQADGDTITLTSTATGSDVGSLCVRAPRARKPPPQEPWQVRAGARRERRRS